METSTQPTIIIEDWPVAPLTPARQRKAWADRLALAESRGAFTADDCKRANSWTTCAIGERFNVRRRNTVQMQAKVRAQGSDEEAAFRLGMEFMHYVADDNIARARETYDAIQAL